MQFEGVGYDQEYDEENLSGEDCEYETWGGAGGTAGGKAKKRSSKSHAGERKKWEAHEDAQLLRLIKKMGHKNWRALAQHMKGRLPKQCRERWINHLDPNITKGKLTDEEWKIVLNCHRELGNRWSEIAKFLPGRTPNQIKNHWHAKVRKGVKRPRGPNGEGSSGSCDESSESEDQTTSTPNKKRKYTVYESLPPSPSEEKKKKSETLPYRGTWNEFEALLETVEILYNQEVSSKKTTPAVMPPPCVTPVSLARPPLSFGIPTLSIPGLPNYDFAMNQFTSVPTIVTPPFHGVGWH